MNADRDRGERLAIAATNIIKTARKVNNHRMNVDDETYVGLTKHAEELDKALTEFDKQRDA